MDRLRQPDPECDQCGGNGMLLVGELLLIDQPGAKIQGYEDCPCRHHSAEGEKTMDERYPNNEET